MSAPTPPQVGTFRIVDDVSSDGVGRLFRALDTQTNGEVALYVLGPEADDAARERFSRAVERLRAVQHPHVLGVRDAGEADGFCYLATDPLFESVSDRGPISGRGSGREAETRRCRRLVRWMVQAAQALHACHAVGLAHGALRPAALLVGEAGRVRLGHFAFTAGREATIEDDLAGLARCSRTLLTGEGSSARRGRAVPPSLRLLLDEALSPSSTRRPSDVVTFELELQDWLEAPEPARPRLRRRALQALTVSFGLALGWGATVGPQAVGHWIDPPPAGDVASANRSFDHRPGGFGIYRGQLPDPAVRPALRLALDGLGIGWNDLVARGVTAPVVSLRARGRDFFVRMGERQGSMYVDLYEDQGMGGHNPLLAQYLRTITDVHVREGMRWQLRDSGLDVDGDGMPEVVLQGRSDDRVEVEFVKFDPRSWRDPAVGWKRRALHRVSRTEPIIADWDGDGRAEILFGDTGRDRLTGTFVGPSQVHVLDYWDGTVEATYELEGELRGTPRLRYQPGGEGVEALYATTFVRRGGRHRGNLLRVRPNHPERSLAEVLPLPQDLSGRLSDPVFVDTDGDGRQEILIGTSDGVWLALDPERTATPIWRFEVGGAVSSQPLLTEQDGDGQPDLCFTGVGHFYCLRTGAGTPPNERIVWRAKLEEGEIDTNRPLDLGDLDGDGAAEIAIATESGHVYILSAGAPGRRRAKLMAPNVTRRDPEERVPTPYEAGLGRIGRAESGRVHVLAATLNGWLVSWEITAASETLRWTRRVASGISATPTIFEVETPTDGRCTAVLIAPLLPPALMLVFDRGPDEPPRFSWGYTGRASVHAKPVVHRLDGALSVVFADVYAFKHRVAIEPDASVRRAPQKLER